MPASRKPLLCWSITLAQNHKPLPPAERVQATLEEFFQCWTFQKEEGKKAGKEHYQVRGKFREAQMTETVLHLFEMRGFDRRDVSIQPESNNSIQQGGLSFYVMKDETRIAGPWHDSAYRPVKKRKYEGNDLKCMETRLCPEGHVQLATSEF